MKRGDKRKRHTPSWGPNQTWAVTSGLGKERAFPAAAGSCSWSLNKAWNLVLFSVTGPHPLVLMRRRLARQPKHRPLFVLPNQCVTTVCLRVSALPWPGVEYFSLVNNPQKSFSVPQILIVGKVVTQFCVWSTNTTYKPSSLCAQWTALGRSST